MNQPKIRITKKFTFETAHVLWGYDGACSNIHGHSYALYVTIIGTPISDPNNPKYGMVMDFSELKQLVNELIVDQIDHGLLIRKGTPHSVFAKESDIFGKIIELDYQPTSENMVIDFARKISSHLNGDIKLHSIRLSETGTSYAEWYADENGEGLHM